MYRKYLDKVDEPVISANWYPEMQSFNSQEDPLLNDLPNDLNSPEAAI